MRVGIGLPNTLGTDGELTMKWARRAEASGFSSLGVFDRLVYDSLDPMATLAACAGVTEQIRLATTIISGPIRRDALLAKEAATLDVLSDGRLTLGVALGARKDDYDAAGVDFDARGRRFSKQLNNLREYWERDEFGPAPVQDGGPQLLIGGESDPTYQRMSRYADGYIHGGGPPRAFARQAKRAESAWNESGRPGNPALWGHGYFALGDDAAEKGREYLLDYYSFTGPFAEKIADSLLTTPQEVVKFVRGYEAEGCEELVLFPTVGEMDQLDRLADVVGEEWARR